MLNRLRKYFYFVTEYIFIIRNIYDLKKIQPMIECKFVPMDFNNYFRVGEFRPNDQIQKYKEKLMNDEIGFFAEHNQKMVGSIWATVNKNNKTLLARKYYKIRSGEVLIYDIFVSEGYRGNKIGPFLVREIASYLFQDHKISTIWIDVRVNNVSSLKMMYNLRLQMKQKRLFVSMLGKHLFHVVIKKYNTKPRIKIL